MSTLAGLTPLQPWYIKQRLRGVALLLQSVASQKCYTERQAWRLTLDIEESIYAVTLTTHQQYERKCMQIAWNVTTNGTFLLATYKPHILAFLDNQKLAEGTDVERWWISYNERVNAETVLLNEENKFDEEEQLSTTSLSCNRCHSRRIAIQQQQIRSADEGMTVFCTCKKCGMRWKM